MTDRDYLLCALHLVLDDEERLDALCPACRAREEEKRCPSCGAEVEQVGAEVNPAFDEERFERMKRGERP